VAATTNYGVRPLWRSILLDGSDAPDDDSLVAVELDDHVFHLTRLDALRFANAIRQVVGIKEVPS
jgi:hypothetical protein